MALVNYSPSPLFSHLTDSSIVSHRENMCPYLQVKNDAEGRYNTYLLSENIVSVFILLVCFSNTRLSHTSQHLAADIKTVISPGLDSALAAVRCESASRNRDEMARYSRKWMTSQQRRRLIKPSPPTVTFKHAG